MHGPDIRELKDQKLAEGKFPASPRSEFRLFMTPDVHRAIQEHAKADVKVEICGVLVGNWEEDEHGPFAAVSEIIRCDNATSKFAEVTFTHESWAQINKEMDTRFSKLRIVGWYHSHPDFGIFLSDRDVFIHQNFFSGAGQLAYVVDPVRDLEGVFVWKDGKPEPIEHYWIGDKIRTVDASRHAAEGDRSARAQMGEAVPRSARGYEPDTGLSRAVTLLSWVALFLLGYMLANMRTRWEQSKVIEGAVAHYGLNKLMKFGFEQDINTVRTQVRQMSRDYAALTASNTGDSEEEQAAKAETQKRLVENFQYCERNLEVMLQKYGLSPEEASAIKGLILEKEAELYEKANELKKASVPDERSGSSSQSSADQPKPADANRVTEKGVQTAGEPPGKVAADKAEKDKSAAGKTPTATDQQKNETK